jgi:hypothetical protein
MNRQPFKPRGLLVIIVLAVTATFVAVVMFLWNSLLPDIFGLPALNYWQTLGVFVLSRILFSGIGGVFGRRGGDFHNHNALRERWMTMSEEERKAFMEKEKDFRTMFHNQFSHSREFRNFSENRGAKNEKEDGSATQGDGDE